MSDRLVQSHLETVNLELAVGGEGEQLVLRVQLPANLAASITMRMSMRMTTMIIDYGG